jgi:hypothetical protein
LTMASVWPVGAACRDPRFCAERRSQKAAPQGWILTNSFQVKALFHRV